jgi:hypothetical protein
VPQRATRWLEPGCGTLAALFQLARSSPSQRRALPAHRITARSGACNCGLQVEGAPCRIFSFRVDGRGAHRAVG